MKADLAPGVPPAVTAPPVSAPRDASQASSASFSIIVPSASIPAARQNRSKLTDTSSHALPTAPRTVGGKAVAVVLNVPPRCFPSLDSTPRAYRPGAATPLLYFNIDQPRIGRAPAKFVEMYKNAKMRVVDEEVPLHVPDGSHSSRLRPHIKISGEKQQAA